MNNHQEIDTYINKQIKRMAELTPYSRVGKIVKVKEGQLYDIQDSDLSATHLDIPSVNPSAQWIEQQWVTYEFNGLNWQIVGFSPVGGA